MFGHSNDQNQQAADNQFMSQPAVPDPIPDDALSDTATSPDPLGLGSAPIQDVTTATTFSPPSDTTAASTDVAPPTTTSTPTSNTDELLTIKQDLLQELSPLVGHLDQSPEEKFRTTMMMIQASDDQSLVKAAYEAAKQISDEKTRAQALLDVVNEINYFTQQHNQQS